MFQSLQLVPFSDRKFPLDVILKKSIKNFKFFQWMHKKKQLEKLHKVVKTWFYP